MKQLSFRVSDETYRLFTQYCKTNNKFKGEVLESLLTNLVDSTQPQERPDLSLEINNISRAVEAYLVEMMTNFNSDFYKSIDAHVRSITGDPTP